MNNIKNFRSKILIILSATNTHSILSVTSLGTHPRLECVEDDLPDAREGPGGASLACADALMGHLVVKGVRPQRAGREGGGKDEEDTTLH